MSGFFMIAGPLVVGFLLGRKWERIVIRTKKFFGVEEE